MFITGVCVLFPMNLRIYDDQRKKEAYYFRYPISPVKITSKSGYRSFTYSAAKLFNNLDNATKCSLKIKEFVNNYWSK